MPRVLLINANTTQSVTDLIERHARAAAGAEVAQV
ncbi:MAG: Asp/Glu racemase, partial [Betaproteobacteria bacterium]|nr:Asp/Glu racemase [Betaproteobacteria bacterium]MBV9362484.1 Asp/Glu racemase [Betaproteobacteria bacterium]